MVTWEVLCLRPEHGRHDGQVMGGSVSPTRTDGLGGSVSPTREVLYLQQEHGRHDGQAIKTVWHFP